MRSRPRFTLISRRTVSVSLIFATACVIVAILLARKEPSYCGYPLSNWVKLLSDINEQDFGPDCTQDKAPDAIVAIGTNALPFLVEWLKYEGGATPVRDVVYKGVQKFPILQKIHGLEEWAWKDSKMVRSAGALIAFRILGSTGAPAIPELLKMARQNPEGASIGPQFEAVEALAYTGEAALPALLSIATNKAIKFTGRSTAARGIGSLGTNAAPAIPALLEMLDDPFVSADAAEALASIGLEPQRVVPALARTALQPWDTHEVIFALRRFGSNAMDAIPTLQRIAEGRDNYSQYNRMSAVSAISQIRTNAPPDSPPSP
jgi:HEAT repeat protein